MQPGGRPGASIGALVDDFEGRWVQMIEACRAKPDRRFKDVM